MKSSLEIILKPEVQEIFDNFSSCFGIRIAYFSPDGKEIQTGLAKPISSYCKLFRSLLNGEKQCLALDESKRKEAVSKRNMVVYQCHAGLTEAVVPLYIEDSLIGFIMIGQIRSSKTIPRKMLNTWNSTFNSSNVFQDAFSELPFISEEQLPSILKLFNVIVEYILMRNMVALKGSLTIDKILRFIKSRPKEDISLSRVSKLVGKSPSTVSHLFTRVTGKSFKQNVIEIKLAQAENYLRGNPEMTIAEVAYKLGYKDPFYFSKLYKKYRGYAPSRFRTSQKSPA